MGTVMVVNVKTELLKENARVAQMIVHTTAGEADLYDGQWQGGTTLLGKSKIRGLFIIYEKGYNLKSILRKQYLKENI
jgi:hypothetical protein